MAEIWFVTCHITYVRKNVLVFFTTDYFPRRMRFGVRVSFMVSVFCTHRLWSPHGK